MVSWQAFPSLLPRAPLAFLSRLKLFFPKLPSLPFQTPATQARLMLERSTWAASNDVTEVTRARVV